MWAPRVAVTPHRTDRLTTTTYLHQFATLIVVYQATTTAPRGNSTDNWRVSSLATDTLPFVHVTFGWYGRLLPTAYLPLARETAVYTRAVIYDAV